MVDVKEEVESVCPECFKEDNLKTIPGEIIEEDGKIYLRKECEEHGEFKAIYWDDPELYEKVMKYDAEGDGVTNPQIEGTNCPEDCGLCERHKSQSVLTNLYVTNRCDLRCSYCFANAGAEGFVYEPSMEQLKEQMKQVRNEEPVPSKAIQITGGEPAVRDDIVEIVELANEMGFSQIQVNTNGIKLGDDPELAKELREAGTNIIYMSFDGVSEETNPWFDQNKKAIENCRKVGMGIVLVPVIINGHNDHEIGDIIEFAKDNVDIIRGVNFQPVSFVGKIENITEERRKNERITYSEMIRKAEEQLDGNIKAKEDWYPVPFVLPISKLVETLKGEPQVEFTAHPTCGVATYAFVEDGELVPITEFVDVEGLRNFLQEKSEQTGLLSGPRIKLSLLWNISDYIDNEKAPEGVEVKDLLKNAIGGGSHDKIGQFHLNSLYIGSMWFQDVWNLNISRLERCVIHYSTPEGVIPFCAYNGLGYGEDIREKNSMSIDEWKEKTGRSLKDDIWEDGPIT